MDEYIVIKQLPLLKANNWIFILKKTEKQKQNKKIT